MKLLLDRDERRRHCGRWWHLRRSVDFAKDVCCADRPPGWPLRLYSPRQWRVAGSIFCSTAPEILPAGGSAKRLGSSERSWKQKKTVSIGKPLSAGETRTFVG